MLVIQTAHPKHVLDRITPKIQKPMLVRDERNADQIGCKCSIVSVQLTRLPKMIAVKDRTA